MAATAYRRDIDGLRGIAILSVLLFHAFPSLVPGGFIGVDIFFVISGYLITAILLRGLTDNQFSYREFYARRIRRIFPALLIVLASTWLLGWFIFFPTEYSALGKHIGGSTLFISNLILWKESGYFDSAAELKPLLHLWSLGVEEQFYILWPALLWLVHRNPSRARWLMLGLLSASLLASILLTAKYPTASFFLLHTRFWQLMLGGMLAYSERSKLAGKLRRPMAAWLGLALILIALICLDKHSAYPGWRALLPTFGAALLILAGERAWLNRNLISNRALVAFGLISYPLYLWHWPLLAYARILHGSEPSLVVRSGTLALAIALAWVTYSYLESPIRFGRFKHSARIIRTLFIGMIIIGIIGATTWQMKGFAKLRPFDKALMADTEKLDAFRQKQTSCDYPFGKDLAWCLVSGKTPPDIAIFGDSHADHLFPGVVNDTTHGWLLIGHSSCPPLQGVGIRYLDKPDECVERNDEIIHALATSPNIKTVILSARGMFYISDRTTIADVAGRNDPANYHVVSPHADEAALSKPQLYLDGMSRTISTLEQAGKHVIVFLDVPELDFFAIRCIPRPITLLAPDRSMACSMPKTTAMHSIQPYRDLMQKLATLHPETKFYDPTNQLCDDEHCYAGNETTLFYRDSNHLSQRGAQKVMADFIQWLDK